jgi:hypothetical protein
MIIQLVKLRSLQVQKLRKIKFWQQPTSLFCRNKQMKSDVSEKRRVTSGNLGGESEGGTREGDGDRGGREIREAKLESFMACSFLCFLG